jgi:hypothetical protein
MTYTITPTSITPTPKIDIAVPIKTDNVGGFDPRVFLSTARFILLIPKMYNRNPTRVMPMETPHTVLLLGFCHNQYTPLKKPTFVGFFKLWRLISQVLFFDSNLSNALKLRIVI